MYIKWPVLGMVAGHTPVHLNFVMSDITDIHIDLCATDAYICFDYVWEY